MKSIVMKVPAVLTAALAMSFTAHGAIVFEDAVEGATGNTYATGGSLADTSWVNFVDTSSGVEDEWRKRNQGYSNGSYFQARHDLPDTMPELTTELTGLSDGTYDIWAFFIDADPGNAWTLSAGLTSGSLTSYSADDLGATTDSSSPVAASTLTFSNAPTTQTVIGDNTFTVYGVKLGQSVVVGGSTVNVYIDNLVGGGSGNRAQYDGVGYELVPEPSSLALLGLGGLLIGRRRRG